MEKKRKNKKKLTTLIALLMCAVLAFGIAGSLAYYTSVSGKITNKFSIITSEDEEELSIELTETVWVEDEEGSSTTTNLEAGEETTTTLQLSPGYDFIKTATVAVSEDSIDCYVYVLVYDTLFTNENMDNAIFIDPSGESSVYGTGTSSSDGWTFVAEYGEYYLYRYYKVCEAGDSVNMYIISGLQEEADDYDLDWVENTEITFYSYAIQAEDVNTDTADGEAITYYNELLTIELE